ncbi:MAG: RNA-binding protein [Candidatus Omnitrophica bacterium]|nr:RNA-binding protein [Candidatus Omnitrophota bacterium]MBU1924397.1 RNA-binding protein [Candidatus Omnitrophota bacterium]
MPEETNKLYVGNLSYTTSEEELKKIFMDNEIEITSVAIIKDKYTSRSKGFGFVEVKDAAELEKAITKLDGQEFNGRKMFVSQARQKRERF